MGLEATTVAFLVYVGAYVMCLIALSIHAYSISEWKDTSTFLRAVYSMRSIYAAFLVQIYDQSTDVAILVAWGILAYRESNQIEEYENVNMLSFLIPSVLLIFVYRIAYWVNITRVFKGSAYALSKTDQLLIFADLYIFKMIYLQIQAQYLSPCHFHRQLQLYESIFESIPQLVLQSIFLIRTYDTALAEKQATWIIFASISASLISVVSKYSYADSLTCYTKHNGGAQLCVVESNASAQPTTTSTLKGDSQLDASQRKEDVQADPAIINSNKGSPSGACHSKCIWFWVRFWRFCHTVARFGVFTLLWAVVGGVYLALYVGLSFTLYFCLDRYTPLVHITRTAKRIRKLPLIPHSMFILQSISGVPLTLSWSPQILQFVDNCIMLSIVYVFGLYKFDCFGCYKKHERNIGYNPYILWLTIAASVGTVGALVMYAMLRCSQCILPAQRLQEAKILGFKIRNESDKISTVHPIFFMGQQRIARKN